jgi:DNA-binding response OmpR family regulator
MADFKTCLLIDDDHDDHEIFMMALENVEKPVKLISEYNAASALSRLRNLTELPDVIFLDLNMPKMNGKQCLVEIRKEKHLNKIPVIVYSTSSEIKDLIETQELGATAYIVKSSSVRELSLALNDLFYEK